MRKTLASVDIRDKPSLEMPSRGGSAPASMQRSFSDGME
jgi:hypothetical protein